MGDKVLVIDDDANLLAAMRRQLRSRFELITALGGEEAVALLEGGERPAVVLCDMRMGGMDGIETLKRVRELSPESVRLMLTGNADMQTAINAINDGAIFRFLTKPCPPEVLEGGLQAAMDQHRLIVAERELLEQTLAGSIKVLSDMLAMVSPEGYSRATRIRSWVRKLTREFNMPFRWQLEIASMLAPLGLLSVPAEVLSKYYARQPVSEEEQAIIDRSPEAARNIVANIPRLAPVAEIIYLQNRGYDGSGFPEQGPVGADLPVDARILRVLNDLAAVCVNLEPRKADFDALQKYAHRYDPTLFRRIRSCLESAKPVNLADLAPVTVSTGVLLPGMVMAADVYSFTGRLVIARLVRISEVHVERLRNLSRLRMISDAVSVWTEEMLR